YEIKIRRSQRTHTIPLRTPPRYGGMDKKQARSLVEFLSNDLPTTYKGLIEKTYTWIEAKEVATIGAPNDTKRGFTTSIKASLKTITKEERRAGTDHPDDQQETEHQSLTRSPYLNILDKGKEEMSHADKKAAEEADAKALDNLKLSYTSE
nr:hypothetical protein [Tanacetum cinerariifolium]